MHYEALFAIVVAYLLGSISSAVITCRLLNLPDPRTQGSNNPGATNVLRIGGKKAGMITLLGDFLKGVIPVLLADALDLPVPILAVVAFTAFLGHLYPIFFEFKGGKGVATAFGCILALSWPAGLCSLATWLTMAVVFRYSSLAAIVTAIAAPFYVFYFTNPTYTVAVTLMSLMLIYRHRSNIRGLVSGEETKI